MTEAEDLLLFWPRAQIVRDNWGDKLNPVLVAFLSGRNVRFAQHLPAGAPGIIHSVIGSHLAAVQPYYVVWGTGFIDTGSVLQQMPRAVTATRGPLSRAKLLAAGCDCPPVYGDPALLYPAMHASAAAPEWDLGIIQHVRDAGISPIPPENPDLRVRVIDINGSLTGVVDAITSCRRIVSSSLHGIIAAHSYGVPAAWVAFSDRPLGDGFKFRDYWASVGQEDVQPYRVQPGTTMADLAALDCPPRRMPDLQALLEACPFMDAPRRRAVQEALSRNIRLPQLIAA